MTDHLQLIKVEVEKSLKEVELDWATSAKEKEEAKKSKAPVFNSILGYTEQKIIINGSPQLIHRVFVETLDSGEYVKCGWVLKCDVSCCMVCAVKFHPAQGFFPWSEEALEKISCHACGNVICMNCSLEAVVKEIFKLGPLPVCCQCSYGQDIVEMVSALSMPPSYRVHQKTIATASTVQRTLSSPRMAPKDTPTNTSILLPGMEESFPRIWKYGTVKVEKITPTLCFEARNRDKAVVYVNICTSTAVPFNLNPDSPHKRHAALTKKNQELMLLIGERGISSTVEGAAVYDVALHPTVLILCSADATGILREKVCAEILRSLYRVQVEPEFTLFTYLPTTSSTIYHERHLSYKDKLAIAGFEEEWLANYRQQLSKHTTTATTGKTGAGGAGDSFNDLDVNDEDIFQPNEVRVYIPLPSISAFFHMEQIVVSTSDLKKPPGNHEKRWLKYKDITQLTDGTLHIPSNKRAKKVLPVVKMISTPILLHCTNTEQTLELRSSSSSSPHNKDNIIKQKQNNSYSVSLQAHNAFIITACRTGKNTGEKVMVHVLHHTFIDDFASSGILNPLQDEVDPLLLCNPKSIKLKSSDGSTSRAYHVVIGSSYLSGIENLTGRRIVAPERIAKILHRVNEVFEDDVSLQRYSLSGVEARPVTEPSPLTVYVYERRAISAAAAGSTLLLPGLGSASTSPRAGTVSVADSTMRASDYTAARPSEALDLTVQTSPRDSAIGCGSSDTASTVSKTPRSTASRLKNFFTKTKRNSHTTAGSVVSTSSVDSHHHDQEEEHKARESVTKLQANRPSSMSIPTHGIAEMDDFSSVSDASTTAGTVAAAQPKPSAAVSALQEDSPLSVTTSPLPRLGMGSALGLTVDVPVNRSESRSTLASECIAASDSAALEVVGSAEQKAIQLNEAKTPLNRSTSAGQDSVASSCAPETTGRPPSSRHSLRAFFTREHSLQRKSQASSPTGLATPTTPSAAAAATTSSSTSPRVSIINRFSIDLKSRSSETGTPSAAPTPRSGTPSAAPTPRSSGKISRKINPASLPGKDLVSPAMLEFIVQQSVNSAVSDGLSRTAAKSSKDANILFGWQIRVHDQMKEDGNGLYVITAVKRTVLGVTEFRITNLVKEDQWVRLKLANKGEGLVFTAVRKVLVVED